MPISPEQAQNLIPTPPTLGEVSNDSAENHAVDALTHYPEVRRSGRASHPPSIFDFDTAMFVQEARVHHEAPDTPLTYAKAISCDEKY